MMKRVHVLGITFLAGFICGLAVPAHAEDVRYTCDNGSWAVDSEAQGEGSIKIVDPFPMVYDLKAEHNGVKIYSEGTTKIDDGSGVVILHRRNIAYKDLRCVRQ